MVGSAFGSQSRGPCRSSPQPLRCPFIDEHCVLLCGSVSCACLGKEDMCSCAILLQRFQVSAWPVRVAWTGQPLPLMLVASCWPASGALGSVGLCLVCDHSGLCVPSGSELVLLPRMPRSGLPWPVPPRSACRGRGRAVCGWGRRERHWWRALCGCIFVDTEISYKLLSLSFLL